jgi:hypothetical protein
VSVLIDERGEPSEYEAIVLAKEVSALTEEMSVLTEKASF